MDDRFQQFGVCGCARKKRQEVEITPLRSFLPRRDQGHAWELAEI